MTRSVVDIHTALRGDPEVVARAGTGAASDGAGLWGAGAGLSEALAIATSFQITAAVWWRREVRRVTCRMGKRAASSSRQMRGANVRCK